MAFGGSTKGERDDTQKLLGYLMRIAKALESLSDDVHVIRDLYIVDQARKANGQ